MNGRKPMRFEKLEVWQAARRLGSEIYSLTQNWPGHEQFGLTAQLRRAVVSISANIAEGSGKNSDRDFARFLEQAYGSCMEVASLLLVASDLGYVASAKTEGLLDAIQSLSNQIAALNRSLNVTRRKTVLAAGPETGLRSRARGLSEPSTFDSRPSTFHES